MISPSKAYSLENGGAWKDVTNKFELEIKVANYIDLRVTFATEIEEFKENPEEKILETRNNLR